MAFEKFLIGGPFKSGLEENLRPWLVNEDAFERLDNAYVFRGRVRKRFGSRLLGGSQLTSRLRINLGNTGASPSTHNLPGGANQLAIGQMFSINNDVFTVFLLGAGVTTYSTNGSITATIDSTVNPNTITFTGAPVGVSVFYYPANPVMGFANFEVPNVNNEPTFAFDTQFAYRFFSAGWNRLSGGTDTWTGSNSQFFWSEDWQGITDDETFLFVTNYNPPDGIRYWDGAAWNVLNPAFNNAGNTIETCRVIKAFNGRLLLMNVVENIGGNRTFVNRVRFSQRGTPITNGAGSSPNAWNQDVPGRGSFLDAPVQEQIISAEFIKDRLIVFLERSTFELVYTGNEILPFRFQKINTELGAESPFSIVPFDKAVLGVANVGIHACTGANVERIDEKIPDDVFRIHNGNDGPFRVHGIRDYFTEMVYWTFPDPEESVNGNPIFPTRVLVYNYENGSWAFNDDSITAFGYHQNISDLTWADLPIQWQVYNEPWNSGTQQSLFRQVICGNQEGFTFLADSQESRNASALQITDISLLSVGADIQVTLTVINHNLNNEDFILVENVTGTTGINGIIAPVTVVDANTIQFLTDQAVAGLYTGGGTLARVTPPDLLTKQFNFFTKEDRNTYIEQVKFLVDRTSNGEFTVEFFPAFSSVRLGVQGQLSGAALSNYIVETRPYTRSTFEELQDQLWHWLYLQGDASTIQLHIFLTPDQTTTQNIAHSRFQLHAMLFYAEPSEDLQSLL